MAENVQNVLRCFIVYRKGSYQNSVIEYVKKHTHTHNCMEKSVMAKARNHSLQKKIRQYSIIILQTKQSQLYTDMN